MDIFQTHQGMIAGVFVGVGFLLLVLLLYICRDQCGLSRKRQRSQGGVIAPPSAANSPGTMYSPTPIMVNDCHACRSHHPCSSCVPGGQSNTVVYHPYTGPNMAVPTQHPYAEQNISGHSQLPSNQPFTSQPTTIEAATGYPSSGASGIPSKSSSDSTAMSVTGHTGDMEQPPPSYEEAVHTQVPSAPPAEC